MEQDLMFDRSTKLLGQEAMDKLNHATVMVVGLGGVGSYSAESLARLGVGNLIIIDGDTIEETNLNRQLFALHSTLGKAKVDVAKARLLDINPKLNLICLNQFLKAEDIEEAFKEYHPDFVIDAIDTITTKIALIKWCQKKHIQEIVCAGTGNKLDPQQLQIVGLNQTKEDPVCRKLRELAKKEGLILSQIRVIYSLEKPLQDFNSGNRTPSSVIFVPATAGLLASTYFLKTFLE
jgi:tRNA threonylcarbamoyladenosine dehydratase